MAGERMNEEEYDEQENAVRMLDQMERTFKKDYDKLAAFFGKLRSKANHSSLDQCIINSQEQLVLSEREENFEAKEKNLLFTRKIDLDKEDLAYLMTKSEVPQNYRIENVDVSLRLNLKLRTDRSSENTYHDAEEYETKFSPPNEMAALEYDALEYDGDSQQTRSSLNGWPSLTAPNSFAIERSYNDEDN